MARKRSILILGAAAVMAIGYFASPYVAVARLANDLADRQAGAALARIDLPAIRQSIARQVARALLAKNPELARKAPLGPQSAGAIASGLVNAYLVEVLTPDALSLFLAEGRLPAGAKSEGTALTVASLASIRGPLALLRHAGFIGPMRFRVAVPEQSGAGAGFLFRLHGVGWRLVGIDLPAEWIERLTADIGSRVAPSG